MNIDVSEENNFLIKEVYAKLDEQLQKIMNKLEEIEKRLPPPPLPKPPDCEHL